MTLQKSRVLTGAMLVAVGAPLACSQTFRGIGIIPHGWESYATGVSGDGSTVVGAAYDPNSGAGGVGGFVAIRWHPDSGLESLGTLPDSDDSSAYGASFDGTVLSGNVCGYDCQTTQPFRWLAPDGPLEGLGTMPNSSYTFGYGVSDDGSTIVGYGVETGSYDVYPIRWREETGVVTLDRFPNGGTAIVHTASLDGSRLAGRGWDADGHEQAARWLDDGSIEGLGFLPDPGPILWSRGRGITPDGSVVVGTAHGADGLGGYTYQGFRWTETGGMVGLGVTGPHGNLGTTAAMDVSANGSVIVGAWGGQLGIGDGSQAAIWHAGIGWQDLATWLITEHDLEVVEDWTLIEALGISNDGSVIVGWGLNRSGLVEGFVATVPVSCPADFNGDGAVNTLDVLAFLNAWAAGEPQADFNQDGMVNTLDVLAFLNAWNVGC